MIINFQHLGYGITEDINRIIASVYSGDIGAIKKVVKIEIHMNMSGGLSR